MQEGFDYVVRQGARADKGMGSFAKELTAEDSAAVRAYLISRANALKLAAAPAPVVPRQETGHADN